MKEKKEVELTPGAVRFLEFVDREGGASEVARKINRHPQFIYNVQNGKAKPSFDTLEILHKAYPGKIDLNYLVLGVSPKQMAQHLPNQDMVGLRDRVGALEMLVEKLEKKNTHLMERNEKLTDLLLERAGVGLRDFLQAASEAPVTFERREVEGFRPSRYSVALSNYGIGPVSPLAYR
jgi:hypothetical protein